MQCGDIHHITPPLQKRKKGRKTKRKERKARHFVAEEKVQVDKTE
jgi:hypothetical protein